MEKSQLERLVLSYKMKAMGYSCSLLLILVFALVTRIHGTASASDSHKLRSHDAIQQTQFRTTNTEPTPVLTTPINTITEGTNSNNSRNSNYVSGKCRRSLLSNLDPAVPVSTVKIKVNEVKIRLRKIMQHTGSVGVYYGIDPEKMMPKSSRRRKPRPPKLEDSMAIALDELKILRIEMEKMRMEMLQLKRKLIGGDDNEASYYIDDESKAKALRKKQTEAEKLAGEIESWASRMLDEGEDDGWAPVECSKMIRASVNGMDRTSAFIKWMVDSRAEKADKEDLTKHPCIKCSSTIDAPLEVVCFYLSQPETSSNYNDVVDNFEDLEEISPNAKICWASSPQILFVKPRNFVTFCHHRWKSDGGQVIVNQACEHPKFPLEKEKEGKSCRGYALRGANFISRCREDPSKTKITIVAHCRPGGGLPDWATKTAVKALAPIEPFKLFHKINEQIILNRERLENLVQENAESDSSLPPGRTARPGGFAQIGYACFWPSGGGIEEGSQDSTSGVHSQNASHDSSMGFNTTRMEHYDTLNVN